MVRGLREDGERLRDGLVRLRRELHRDPEIGLDLPRTQGRVLAALDGLPLEVSTGRGLSSVTAVLRGARPGPVVPDRPGPVVPDRPRPVVLLRGDMDALPVTELSGLPFASERDGVMHACGHDLHTAGLVGAARLLAARRDELGGDVVFMFQPGEEGYDGAQKMIDEGVLDAAGRPVDAAYGLHVVAAGFPRGTFACRPGPFMAAAGGLFVRVVGAGGHGSAPHDARDPIPAACEMVTALQTMVTRRFSPFEPVVLTVGEFHAGTLRNIIPDEAVFSATVRTFSAEAERRIAAESVALCEGIAAAHGLRAEARYVPEYPVTVNDDAEFEHVAGTVAELFGAERFHRPAQPDPGSEDFSRVLQRVPGAYLFLGAAAGEDPAALPDNHSPRAVFDDDVLVDGAVLLAALAIRRMAVHMG